MVSAEADVAVFSMNLWTSSTEFRGGKGLQRPDASDRD
jgi:hypothetical protein